MSMDDFLKTLTDEQKEALRKALNTTENTVQDNVDKDFKTEGVTTSLNKNKKRREPVKARKNEWTDTGEFRDNDTKYGDRVPRSRKPHSKVDVECSVCGKSFKVDPRYTYGEYHRCSKCVGR